VKFEEISLKFKKFDNVEDVIKFEKVQKVQYLHSVKTVIERH